MISKNIVGFGVELEGAWEGGNTMVKGDGSVYFEAESEYHIRDEYAIGEIAMPPYRTMSVLKNHLATNWPDAFNETCGMHIHMEISPLAWLVLGSQEGYDAFIMKAKRHFLDLFNDGKTVFSSVLSRLAGNHEYCDGDFVVEAGLLGRISSRYHILNGLAYRRHGTLELRVWPQLEYIEGMEMINFTVKGIEEVIAESKIIDNISDRIIGADRVLTEANGVPTMAEMRKEKSKRFNRDARIDSSLARARRVLRHSRGERCADLDCMSCHGEFVGEVAGPAPIPESPPQRSDRHLISGFAETVTE